jgi:CRISPR-associated endonuclease Csn1
MDAKNYLEERGIINPSRDDIVKYRLWIECKEQCPYTGKSIGFNDLFGNLPLFDIEHIIPYSICLENRFENLTLCHSEENRKVKHNKTPFEAYSGNPQKYKEILSRVKGFNSRADIKFNKYKRFTTETTEEYADYASRQLNDTRYASRTAVDYLGLLYGGAIDLKGKRKIYAVSGGITFILRNYMGLNFVLGGGVKSREDHRHHAIDALAIALATSGNIQGFSHYAQRFENIGRVSFRYQFEPWKGFLSEVNSKVDNIITVHHVSQKVRGSIHEDTFYGRGTKKGTIHLKRPLKDMKETEVDEIVDPVIRKIVKEKLSELSTVDIKNKDPKKAFSSPENLPVMQLKNGDTKTIKSVRICRNQNVTTVGKGPKQRNVVLGNNHHIEIVAVLDEKGNETKWEGHIVSLYEAYRRKKQGEPIIRKDFGERKLFKFSLSRGDYIEIENNGKIDIYVIRKLSNINPKLCQIFYIKPNDARIKKEIKQSGLSKTSESLRKSDCKKLTITPFGEVRCAHD